MEKAMALARKGRLVLMIACASACRQSSQTLHDLCSRQGAVHISYIDLMIMIVGGSSGATFNRSPQYYYCFVVFWASPRLPQGLPLRDLKRVSTRILYAVQHGIMRRLTIQRIKIGTSLFHRAVCFDSLLSLVSLHSFLPFP